MTKPIDIVRRKTDNWTTASMWTRMGVVAAAAESVCLTDGVAYTREHTCVETAVSEACDSMQITVDTSLRSKTSASTQCVMPPSASLLPLQLLKRT